MHAIIAYLVECTQLTIALRFFNIFYILPAALDSNCYSYTVKASVQSVRNAHRMLRCLRKPPFSTPVWLSETTNLTFTTFTGYWPTVQGLESSQSLKCSSFCFWTNLQHFCLFSHGVKHYKYLPGDSGRKCCLQSPDEILSPIPDHLSNNMLKCYHGLFDQWRQTRVAYRYVNSWVTAGLQYEITLSNTTSPYHLAPNCLAEIYISRIMCHRSTAALQDLNMWIK